nr:hypothetical protein [Anaerolineae bacterium]
MSLSPSLTFGLALATLYGAVLHLILGGSGRQLLVFCVAAWIGFAIGQAIGNIMEIHVFAIGSLNILTATLGSIIACGTAAVLSTHSQEKSTR